MIYQLLASYVTTSLPIELLTMVGALLLGTLFASTHSLAYRIGRRTLNGLATRPWRCGLLIFAISLGINAALSAIHPPQPWVHDEFSYLLASDTFAHGRLTNPSHPHWQHFETFHVLSQPSYMSKYPPANGLVLSVGQRYFGNPIVGSWLSVALACAACYWMFRAWLPSRWAVIGGLLIATMPSITLSWGQSFWGGGVAMLGGALLFGAVRHLWLKPRLRDSLLLGCGLTLLANSRPMEGFLASLPVIGSCLYWLVKKDRIDGTQNSPARRIMFALPAVAVGLAGGLAMLNYNRAVTDHAWRLPYREHDANYAASSLLIWKQPPPIPQYNHDRMRSFYVSWARDRQVGMSEPTKYLASICTRLSLLWDFFSIAGGLCLVGVVFARRSRWVWFAGGCIGLILAVELQLATSQLFPHYVAPIASAFWILSIVGLRASHLRIARSFSRRWASGLIAAVFIVAALKSIPWLSNWNRPRLPHPREQVAQTLREADADTKHLVLVSYDDDYSIHAEWVYNAASIDDALIVWARDMGAKQNRELLEYYPNRKVWYWHLRSLDDYDLSPDQPLPLARSGPPELPRVEARLSLAEGP